MAVVNMTAAFIRSLTSKPPDSGRVEYWDSLTAGLCLRVSPTGQGTWTFRYRPREGAGFQRITLGKLNELTLAEARERVLRHRVAVSDGGDPQGERKARRHAASQALTFDGLAQRYLNEYAKPNKKSWRNDEGYLKRPQAAWGARAASTITRRNVIALLDAIRAEAPVSANRTHTILTTLFNWAVEGELLEATPIAGLKKRARETAKERVLSDPEIRVLWQKLDGAGGLSDDVADALKLILVLGQRPGEVAGALQSELIKLGDAVDARWEIPAGRTKAGRAHVVPLPPMGMELFKRALSRRAIDGDGQSVFASKFTSRKTIARHSLSHGLSRVIQRLPVDGPDSEARRSLKESPPTPHDLRRTLATGLARLGVPREDRKAVLAHIEGDVHGQHYDKYERLREKRSALVTWEEHLAALVK
ncbi:site-specific integrase [Methylobacterium sp. V23]|uniref:tyrosine-type recombinase/integrase n=1 Tax=Methylobacterium sp. V23 TaxID=2044878 RepID=UPI000CDB521F|nr:site-specific integrase [Methylobacterium sp. V23]POR42657.1 hypothetical protein CRT23_12830 [Methylobacterium sp. V23]